MAQVNIAQLIKRYGNFTALKQLDLEIPDGSFTAILGPSGCGKTTLLRCVAGLLMPDEGQIFIGDQDVTRLEPFRRNLGMVFQRPSMFPHMTVFNNIAWGLKLRGWAKADIPARVREMLRLVRLSEMENRTYQQLSGGQAQRVVIARALAPKPDLLLLDEPLSALDAKLREELLTEIAEIHRQTRCTTLLVTHDQSEALTVADNLVLMNEGEIVQQGAPLDIYRNPQTVFSANFIGTNNLLPCTVVNNGAHTQLQLDGTDLRLNVITPRFALTLRQPVWACVRADDIDVLDSQTASLYKNVVTVEMVRTTLTGGSVSVEAKLADVPIRINVGGSQRFNLLDSTHTLTCALSHITVVAREAQAAHQ